MSASPPAPTGVDAVTGLPVAIRYVDVFKSFGEHKILKGLNLAVPRGAVTVIIGRSGTGKSVTLKHIMGLLRPDSGQIYLGDDDLTQFSDRQLRTVRNRFGIVFQHAALFDFMSVFENIAFPLREHTRLSGKQIREKVMALIAQVGLTGSEEKYPSELSGGMQKRVALARGLVRDPEFILYDEPTTGLDPILAAAMDKLIMETGHARPDITSIVISHDMHAVLHIADKVAMMVDGEIYAEGDKDYFRNNDDPLIRQFLAGSLDGPMKV